MVITFITQQPVACTSAVTSLGSLKGSNFIKTMDLATILTDPLLVERLDLLPSALYYCVYGPDDII